MPVSDRKPNWLKIKLPRNKLSAQVSNIVNQHRLHTICTSGKCPNQGECWDCGTATFMICGDICTRSCKFCNVTTGKPLPLDENEPESIANAIKLLNLKHAIITSVDRDDIPDLGASHWAAVIRTVKQKNPNTTMEVLIPDFQGKKNFSLFRRMTDCVGQKISENDLHHISVRKGRNRGLHIVRMNT